MLNALRRLLGRERRGHPRRSGGGVTVTVAERETTLVDWSPGGFRVADIDPPAPGQGDLIAGTISVGEVSGPYTAFVVAVHADGGIGARFDEIDSAVFRALAGGQP